MEPLVEAIEQTVWYDNGKLLCRYKEGIDLHLLREAFESYKRDMLGE